jgi:sugar/nucleoside kinase (ribokinase family)
MNMITLPQTFPKSAAQLDAVISGSYCRDIYLYAKRPPLFARGAVTVYTVKGSLSIELAPGSNPKMGSKVFASSIAEIEKAMAFSEWEEIGGGAANSLRFLASRFEARLALVQQTQRTPVNIIILDRSSGNRLIVKSPKTIDESLSAPEIAPMEALVMQSRFDALILNSPSNLSRTEWLLGRAISQGRPIYAEATSAFDPETRLAMLMPCVDLQAANLSEWLELFDHRRVAGLLNSREETSVLPAAVVAALKRVPLPGQGKPSMVVTLGAAGFVSYDPRSGAAFHGSLNPDAMERAKELRHIHPETMNGAGDRFFGALAGHYHFAPMDGPNRLAEAARRATADVASSFAGNAAPPAFSIGDVSIKQFD